MNSICKDRIIKVFFPMYKIILLMFGAKIEADDNISIPNEPDIENIT